MPKQTIVELRQRVAKIAEIFNDLLTDVKWTNLPGNIKNQITTGINKAYGQAVSFKLEYETTMKAQNKGRRIITQEHADVTVGKAEKFFAKSIECKSVTAPTNTDVNTMITKAIKQLAGLTGHQTRLEDVKIIDLRIDGNNNPWPLPGGTYGRNRDATTLDQIKDKALLEINRILGENNPAITNIKGWLNGTDLTDAQEFKRLHNITFKNEPSARHPKSTRPVFLDSSRYVNRIRCITFKIRYSSPYYLNDAVGPNRIKALDEIVLQYYKKGNVLILEVAKINAKIYDFTGNIVGNVLSPANTLY